MTMTMTTAEFLATLRERDVRLWAEGGRLKCDAPPGALDDELREQLVARKHELLGLVSGVEASLAAPRSLVPLKPTGDQPPLFARPGHNGDVFCYRPLADHLDERRPLYGIEPKGLDGSPVPGTIEEMAAYEVEQIRAFQPEGPYFLAGYCAGGSITFETARQLSDSGAEVARVIMFGAPFPTTYRVGGVRAQVRSLSQRGRMHATRLRGASVAQSFSYLGARANACAERVTERYDPAFADRRRVEEATVAAVKLYDPRTYAGRIDMFLPNEAWRHSGDRPDDWRPVSGMVVEHIGPDECDGDTMLLEPYVQALADMLNPSLDEEKGG